MAKDLLYDSEMRKALEAGVDKISDAVRVTLGPKGRNVAFDQKYDVPLVTNDGVTIAKQIILEDPFENAGANLMKVAAMKTNDAVGDGTTASIVLAQKLIKDGLKNVAAGANPVMLKKGIDGAADIVCKEVLKAATPVNDKDSICHVATISGNNDSFIGECVSEAFDKVGLNGVVTLEDSQQMETTLKCSNGIRLDNGYLSDYFINNPNNKTVELDNPYIFLAENAVKNFKDILHVLEQVAQEGASLLIISQDVEGDALSTLALNVAKGTIKAAAVKCPGYGDTRKRNMKELCLMLKGTMVTPDTGMKINECGLEVCGHAERVVISKEETVIQSPAGANSEEVTEMIRQIRKQLVETKEDYEIEKLQTSLSLLAGGIAIITVGGVSELEMFERKYRMEDAVNAVYAAIDEGIVPGGGKALILAIPALDEYIATLSSDERTGAQIVREALEAPVRQIAENAGVDASVVADALIKSKDKNYGFDALTLEYTDMYERGIIDPAKVIRNSMTNAASVASMFLTTNAGVVDPEVDDKEKR